MRSLTLAEIVTAAGASVSAAVDSSAGVLRIATDSRSIRRGELFWALTGDRFDGHEFVADALAAGAVAAVVSREVAGGGPLVRVRDTRRALGDLAAWYRQDSPAQVIGITGSVGKTSTREAVYAVLRQRSSGIRSRQNFNNEIGVPLTLLELEPEHEFAVIEMGASGPGEIARLAQISQPELGVLTAIGPAHLEGFGSLEGVAAGKAELVRALGRDGTAVLNADDALVQAIGERADCRVVWFGTGATRRSLDVQGHDIDLLGERVAFRVDGGPRVELRAAGRHQVLAALAAVAVARQRGMHEEQIREGLAQYRPPPMRCEVEHWAGVTVINDTYNASPQSMSAALDLLGGWRTPGRRVLVCGDMKELGPTAPDHHRQLGQEIARRRSIDRCIAVGPLSEQLVSAARIDGMAGDAVMHCESADQAVELLGRTLRAGDVVLLKASRAMHLERAIQGLRTYLERNGA
jgi:UDP-N-acetylmuramoyl-tripeptide--D-alanyl-D-alanine ligase